MSMPNPVSTSGIFGSLLVRRTIADVSLAIVLFVAVALMDVVGPDQRGTEALAWDLALVAPLVARRSYPQLAAAFIALVCLAQWYWGPPAMGDIAVLVMLYTLGTRTAGTGGRRERRALVVAVLIAQLGVVMAVTRWQPHQIPSTLVTLTGTVTAAWGAGIYFRTRRAWVEALRERAETAERERDHLARMAVATERARIARELHDVVAHSLSVMITLNDAATAIGATGRVRDTVEQASEVGREALAEMHRLLNVLRDEDAPDPPNDPGAAPAAHHPHPTTAQLSDLAALVRSAGPRVELSTTGDLARLPPSMQLAAYRIVQESLTNVLKHARNVDRVNVDLTLRNDGLTISVTDDGQTVVPAGIASARVGRDGTPPGLGLLGMRERALVFGGNVQTGPHEDRGWRVSTTLKLPGVESDPHQTRIIPSERVGR